MTYSVITESILPDTMNEQVGVMHEMKRFAMDLDIPERLFLQLCDAAGVRERECTEQQRAKLASLLFFPASQIEPEEILFRLKKCIVNTHYYPKTMDPDGGKWHFDDDLNEYFIDEKWVKERLFAGKQAPLRRLNAAIFPYHDESLNFLLAIGILLENGHNLSPKSMGDASLMGSSIQYDVDRNYGQIVFRKSEYNHDFKCDMPIYQDEKHEKLLLSYELEFGEPPSGREKISRDIDVPFATIRDLGYVMRTDGLMG